MLIPKALAPPLPLGVAFQGPMQASAGASQAGVVASSPGISPFSSRPNPGTAPAGRPAGQDSLAPEVPRSEGPSAKEALFARAQEALARFKDDPRTPLDYAGFLLDLERATRADFDRPEIRERWDEACEAIRGIIEKPADLFEACFPGAVNEAAFQRRISKAVSFINARYFQSHRDTQPHMSGFLTCGIGNCSARTKFLISALAPLLSCWLPPQHKLAIKVFQDHVEAALYDSSAKLEVAASLYHPAILFHAFLKRQGHPSPVEENDLIFHRGSRDQGDAVKALQVGMHDDPLRYPKSNVPSGLVSTPWAMQKIFNRLAQLPGGDLLRRGCFHPWNRHAAIAAIALSSSMGSYHYIYLQNFLYAPKSLEQCRADPPSGADATPEEHARRLRYLGFSFVSGSLGFAYQNDWLCFEDPADAVEMGGQLTFSGRLDTIEPHLVRFLGTGEFSAFRSFLDDPARALATLPDEQLVGVIIGMRDYERVFTEAAGFSRFFGKSERTFLQSIVQKDPRARAYFEHLAELRTWAQLHPRDALAFVNAAPLNARAALLEILLSKTMSGAFHFAVRASPDVSSRVVTPPPKHTPPMRYVEVDISQLPAAKVADDENADGFSPSSALVERNGTPALFPEDESQLHVEPATVALLLQFTSRASHVAFAKLSREGAWTSAVSEAFQSMGPRRESFYTMLGGYIDYLESIPDHLTPFLDEGVQRGLIFHDGRRYVARHHFAHAEERNEDEAPWLDRTLSFMSRLPGHRWMRR